MRQIQLSPKHTAEGPPFDLDLTSVQESLHSSKFQATGNFLSDFKGEVIK